MYHYTTHKRQKQVWGEAYLRRLASQLSNSRFSEESTICPAANIPNVSVEIEVTNLAGAKTEIKGVAETVNFDVKVRLEEVERKSQMIIVGFNLLVTTKPAVLKLEVGGKATLTGKNVDVRKMLDVDPETKMPMVLPRIYQHAFTAMYLLATVLDAPPPPHDLLYSGREGTQTEGVSLKAATGNPETKEANDGVTIQADTSVAENTGEKTVSK